VYVLTHLTGTDEGNRTHARCSLQGARPYSDVSFKIREDGL